MQSASNVASKSHSSLLLRTETVSHDQSQLMLPKHVIMESKTGCEADLAEDSAKANVALHSPLLELCADHDS